MTTDLTLYFGPNNDPGDTSGTRHWQYPHAPDFHNPAFTINSTVDPITNIVALDIDFAIRSRDTVNSHTMDNVRLYVAACGILNTVDDVNALVNLVVSLGAAHEWPDLFGQSMDVPKHNAVSDAYWSPPNAPYHWVVPAYAPGFIVIATLTCTALGQSPQSDYASDPSVGIWLG